KREPGMSCEKHRDRAHGRTSIYWEFLLYVSRCYCALSLHPGISRSNISCVRGWVLSCSNWVGSSNGPMLNCESKSSPVAACQSAMELYWVSSHQNGIGSSANR